MDSILSRLGLVILAAALFFIANRVHKKATGKAEKGKKVTATVFSFGAGLCALGTFFGDWIAGLADSSPYLAAAFFILTAGIVVFDWWADGKPDRPAFIAAFFLPLAIVVGFSQLDTMFSKMGDSAEKVGSTIQGSSR